MGLADASQKFAEFLGITTDQLKTELQADNATIATVAAAHGKSRDQVKTFEFDGDTYQGQGTRGLFNPATEIGVDPPQLSGTVYAWNLITDRGQAVASGLYLFSIKDHKTGDVQRGKFLVVKSDKETFE